MQDTEHAPAEGGLQERQLVAGRYRLTARHHEDEATDVWRAFDEPGNHVVILAFLRDRSPESRDHFVTEARRIASQPPTVVRVAGIHDEPDATFIVYEDVVPGSTTELTDVSSIGHGLSGLRTVIGLRDPALIDSRLLMESASEFAASARSRLTNVHLDEAQLNTIVTGAGALLDRVVGETRARLEGVDPSGLGSVFESGIVAAQRLTNLRPHVRVPKLPSLSLPRFSMPTPRVRRTAPPSRRRRRIRPRGRTARWNGSSRSATPVPRAGTRGSTALKRRWRLRMVRMRRCKRRRTSGRVRLDGSSSICAHRPTWAPTSIFSDRASTDAVLYPTSGSSRRSRCRPLRRATVAVACMHQLRPPQRIYMSKKHGYALALPPSWHKAICGNSDPAA